MGGGGGGGGRRRDAGGGNGRGTCTSSKGQSNGSQPLESPFKNQKKKCEKMFIAKRISTSSKM